MYILGLRSTAWVETLIREIVSGIPILQGKPLKRDDMRDAGGTNKEGKSIEFRQFIPFHNIEKNRENRDEGLKNTVVNRFILCTIHCTLYM